MSEKILELIDQMSIDEKVNQLVQTFDGEIINHRNNDDNRKQNNLEDDKVWQIGSISGVKGAQNVRQIQETYLSNSRLKIPLLFMLDVIHGYEINFQIAAGLGCSFDDQLVYDLSKMQAQEAALNGTTVTYSPMSDYTCDARWGRIMEIVSEDVVLSKNMLAQMVKGIEGDLDLNKGNIASCVKHIAAYGLASGGRDYDTADASKYFLNNKVYPLYKAGIEAGTSMVMTSFNTLDGVPCTANKHLLKEKLRDNWKFNGIVISDHSSIAQLDVHGYSKDLKQSAEKSFNAGVDIELATYSYPKYLKELLEEGKITIEDLDKSVYRVLELKEKLGLFDNPYKGIDEIKASEFSKLKENKDLVVKAGEDTIVLLENNGVLPLDTAQKTICVGPLSNTKEMVGFNACNANLDNTITVVEGLNKMSENEIKSYKCCDYTDLTINKSELLEVTKEVDTVILAIGEYQRHSGEGVSRGKIDIFEGQLDIARTLKEAGKKVVSIVFSGRPLVLTELKKYSDAMLFAWFPGTLTGISVANLIYGKSNFNAKLSFSMPQNLYQLPICYDHLNTGRPKSFQGEEYVTGYFDVSEKPLYEFGYGLSYTTYEYSNLNIEVNDDSIDVSINVLNKGKTDGREIVQLYITDLVSSYCRPVKELKKYKKINLRASEQKQVSFKLNKDDLSYYDELDKLIFESGEFLIHVGSSSSKVISEKIYFS